MPDANVSWLTGCGPRGAACGRSPGIWAGRHAVQRLSIRPGLARERTATITETRRGAPLPTGRILVLMKPARAASRRFLPGSPFNVLPVDPPVEQFAVRDRVTHDKYGLGWVVLVEDDDAVIVVFGSRKVRILSPYARLTKL